MLCVGVGVVAGLAVSVMLVAPYIRKFGAPTIPAYFGQRFESGPLRLLAATVCVLPLMLLAIAEIKIGMMSLMWLIPIGSEMACGVVALALAVTVLPGGIRSLSWSGAAQAVLVLVAILVPAAIAAVIETNLPFGQLSHGPIVRAVARLEAAQDVPIPVAAMMGLELPGAGFQPVVGRLAAMFGSIGPFAYVLMTFSVIIGIVGAPTVLARAVTTPSVYATRKSFGWATALVGVLLLTLASIAAFERDVLANSLAAQSATALPTALQRLVDAGLVAIEGGTRGHLTSNAVLFDRDGMLPALPVMMGMPLAVIALVAAGVLAAALAGAAASITQLGIIIAEDVVGGPSNWQASDGRRLIANRLAILGVVAVTATGAMSARGDAFLLMLYAIVLSGSAVFPMLVMSIWWKRLSTGGAIAGMLAGLAVALVVLLADPKAIGLPGLVAPVLALPTAWLAAGLANYLTPAPGRHILEMVRDLRIPGGETIYDREIRQARQRGQRLG
jgi:cation/acetate symporter